VSLALDSEVPAFREIFDRHAPVVRRYLAQRLKNNASADEATQETFVRALRRLPSLRDPRLLRPWLLGIARRVSSEHRRAEERRLRLVVPTDAEQVEASAVSLDTPESQLLDHEDLRLVNAAVEGLRPERRRALSLRVDQDLGYGEIAAELGWSIPKVKNEIHRARLELKAVLAMSLGVLAFIFAVATPGTRGRGGASAESGACYENGMGAAAALESEYRACLIASPLPTPSVFSFGGESGLDICGAIDICD